jgi:DNA-binding CsgD family transcriptional regulator
VDVRASGEGRVALITGEAGIGKSALARYLASDATGQGIPSLAGHSYDLSSMPPYQPWIDAFTSRPDLFAPPAGFLSDLDGDGSPRSQRRMLNEVLEFLTRSTTGRPILLCLEDMQWADHDSLELLRFVSHRLADLPLLLLVTYRDTDVNDPHPFAQIISRLVRESRPPPERITLRRLDAAATREIVAQRYQLPRTDEARLVNHLQSRAQGNPFFMHEILRSLEDEKMLEPADGAWRLRKLAHVRVPGLIRQLIEERVDRLGQETRALLQVAAVIGQNVPVDLWHAVSDVSEDSLVEIAERPLDAGLLEETPDGVELRFSHALIRESLYESLALPRRRVWHRRVAEAMAAAEYPAETVAFHFEHAGDRRAIEWHIKAGERAQRVAWLSAARSFEAALGLLERFGSGPRERGWLALRPGLLHRFADPPASLRRIEQAMELAAEAGDALLTACALCVHGYLRRIMGDVRGGIIEERAGVAALDALPARERTEFQRLARGGLGAAGLSPHPNLIAVLAHVGNFDEVRLLAWKHVSEQETSAETSQCRTDATARIDPLIHYGLGAAAAAAGQPDEARTRFSTARDGFRAAHDQILAGCVVMWELYWVALPYYADAPAIREALASEAEDAHARASGAQGEWSPRAVRLPNLVLEGGWDEARKLADESYRAQRVSPRYEAAVMALARLAREQGAPGRAWGLIREILPDGPATEPGAAFFLPTLELIRLAAELAIDGNDLGTAITWLDTYDRWLDWGGGRFGRSESCYLAATYLQAIGDGAQARARAEQALSIARNPRQPLALQAAHRLLGEILLDEGDWASASRHLAEALDIASSCRSPIAAGEATLALARLRGAQRRTGEATDLIGEARSICLRLGARRLLGLAESLETALRQPDGASAYPFGLTAREHEVLRLVAAGLTNAEIADRLYVSRRTVEQHAYTIYRKLGVSSRVAAARHAFEHHLL